jgi:hypothetical protein
MHISVCLLVLAALLSPALAQVRQFWNTVHHDIKNSGRANFEGPGMFALALAPNSALISSLQVTRDFLAPLKQ